MIGDSRRATRVLRQAYRRELRRAPSETRRARRKAPKVSESPLAGALTVVWFLIISYLIVPTTIYALAQNLADNPGFWRALPYPGMFWAWMTMLSARHYFDENFDSFLSRVLPVSPEAYTRNIRRRTLRFILGAAGMYAVTVGLFLAFKPLPFQPVLAWGMWHGAGLFLTVLLGLGCPVRLPGPSVFAVLAGLWALRLFGGDTLPAAAPFIDLLGALPPVGWTARAQEAWEAGQTLLAVAFLVPLLPAAWMAVMFYKRQDRALHEHLLASEWMPLGPGPEPENAPENPLVTANPDLFAGPFRAAWTWIPEEKKLLLEFLTGGALPLGKPKLLALLLLGAGGLLQAVPHEVSWIIGMGCIGCALLMSTPLIGGTWPGLRPLNSLMGQDAFLFVYPVDTRETLSLMTRVNRRRFFLALPLWAFAAVCLGLNLTTFSAAFIILGSVWLTALGVQRLFTWSQLIQFSALPARGKFIRALGYGFAMLVWFVLVVVTVVMGVLLPFMDFPMRLWPPFYLVLVLWGEAIVRIQLADCTGTAYDYHFRSKRKL